MSDAADLKLDDNFNKNDCRNVKKSEVVESNETNNALSIGKTTEKLSDSMINEIETIFRNQFETLLKAIPNKEIINEMNTRLQKQEETINSKTEKINELELILQTQQKSIELQNEKVNELCLLFQTQQKYINSQTAQIEKINKSIVDRQKLSKINEDYLLELITNSNRHSIFENSDIQVINDMFSNNGNKIESIIKEYDLKIDELIEESKNEWRNLVQNNNQEITDALVQNPNKKIKSLLVHKICNPLKLETLLKEKQFWKLFYQGICGFSKSKILSSNQIGDLISIIGKVVSAEKIYDTTENGERPIDFHRCCDGKLDTLVIIKSENGSIAGGYSDVDWSGDNWKKSEKSFLFSLDKKRKYSVLIEEKAVLCNSGYHARFGG